MRLCSVVLREALMIDVCLNLDTSFNGWRLTMVDSLDTMLIMGLHREFYDAVPVLANMTFALDEVRILRFVGLNVGSAHR